MIEKVAMQILFFLIGVILVLILVNVFKGSERPVQEDSTFVVEVYNGNAVDRQFTCSRFTESSGIFTFYKAGKIIDVQATNCTWGVGIHEAKDE